MIFRPTIAAILIVTAAPAAAMPVSNFLAKAEALKKGPLALFSGDIKLLMNQIKADSQALRSERLAAEQAGKRGAFCPPAGGVKMTDKDVLQAMEAVPAPRRAQTSTKDAMRAYMVRRFPCRA
ncbi:hypothetical protein H9L13_03820 [Sphingomonas lutea]|uniref:Rap1a immunity protein domain-containing protein n=1 Tax=Sphingomonas lutea TaxID=1045317 RepID=A0A7G9SJL7_9SPHN|nr:hypothetical protein [Sphingomonas lutea]QNN68042.1 hypothetical protein H9L13_03820 [Sphingomonas lutea]